MITCCLEAEIPSAGEVELEGDAYHHLFRARRVAVGDRLRLVDGRGDARWARVAEVNRRHARLRLAEAAPRNEPLYRLELLVAALRPERASWLVEKATELGAAAVRFVSAERSPRSYGQRRIERFRRVARAALEQCHRAHLPEVSGVHAWAEVPELIAGVADRWLLDPGAERRWMRARSAAGIVAIGPEGGWSESEATSLAALGCRASGLGPRLLRAETAALAAAVLVMGGAPEPPSPRPPAVPEEG